MQPVRLAVDVMSGDYGPSVMVRGIFEARRRFAGSLRVYACGQEERILAELDNLRVRGYPEARRDDFFRIEPCADTVSAGDRRSRVWSSRKRSSIVRAVALQKEGSVDASISAGDTGILMGASIFILGRMPGIGRPALAALVPTSAAHPSLLTDVGANLQCRPAHLRDFAVLGRRYMMEWYGLPDPAVAILSIGREHDKGTRLVREADDLFCREVEGYQGFAEGSDIFTGKADVLVCDGFTGNIVLKACESFSTVIDSLLTNREEPVEWLKRTIAPLDPDHYGAVPLLGIEGTVLKAHGGSSPTAIAHAVDAAIKAVKNEKQR